MLINNYKHSARPKGINLADRRVDVLNKRRGITVDEISKPVVMT